MNEIERSALHNSSLTVYAQNEAEVENIIGQMVYPMNTGEYRKIFTDKRVFCLYKMDSGKVELNSYSFKRKGA